MDRTLRNPPRYILYAGLIVLLSSILLAACGGSENSGEMSGDQDSEDSMAFAARDNQSAVAPAVAAAEVSDHDGSDEDSPAAGQIAYDRLVIRTAQITLTVEDTVSATASVRNLATTRGGFVFSSTTYTENERQYAQLTLRVPADRFDDTVSDLRAAPWVEEIVREESSSQDVSAEYVDNESRLTALEETQRRYLALLSEASTIESILRLESELTNVRSQIESIKGRQNYLGEMTSFSTITVTLRPVDGMEPEDEENDGFALTRIFQDAWDRSSGALAGLAETTIVVAIFVLFTAPFGLLGYLSYRSARRIIRRDSADIATRHPVD